MDFLIILANNILMDTIVVTLAANVSTQPCVKWSKLQGLEREC